MANSERKIKSAVRYGSRVFDQGQEDELAEFASQEDLNRLVKAGHLAGEWKKKGKAAEADKK